MILSLLLWSFVAVLATGILWKGSDWLEQASEGLSTYYELPDIVQGALVVAVGSSFPELATVVISTILHGEFELGVAAIVGSAIFNILIIPAAAGLVAKNPLQSNRDLVYKEAQFYIISVAVLIITFSFAAIFNPVSAELGTILGEMDRTLALLPIALYCFYIFIQYQDTMDFEPEMEIQEINPLKQWGMLGLSLVVILIGVELLVRAAIEFGDLLGTPSFLWGISVVAAGTSVPDAFVSVKKARKGEAVTSLANVLGSNIFDLLICIPVGVLIAGTAVINFSVAAPLMGALTLATLLLFSFMRTHMILGRRESVALIMLYILFLIWMGLENFGVIDSIPSLPG
ncbi:sodium:calcium antiporter [Aliifodinibius sp. S!AR15-10]|uniref:sodium:calcium antiporter n=1 Tax=Aliifodinibius sp. S!AR15-10 TaxID=2950437 RepID=UPI00285C10C6|nr:sodium:calcium antiporter [Aliifodinibius sp. S!AR15-10]MDR8393750.1 sodium:calcium antiporter [Aliifodinibius sp. S!AR15-10]